MSSPHRKALQIEQNTSSHFVHSWNAKVAISVNTETPGLPSYSVLPSIGYFPVNILVSQRQDF